MGHLLNLPREMPKHDNVQKQTSRLICESKSPVTVFYYLQSVSEAGTNIALDMQFFSNKKYRNYRIQPNYRTVHLGFSNFTGNTHSC